MSDEDAVVIGGIGAALAHRLGPAASRACPARPRATGRSRHRARAAPAPARRRGRRGPRRGCRAADRAGRSSSRHRSRRDHAQSLCLRPQPCISSGQISTEWPRASLMPKPWPPSGKRWVSVGTPRRAQRVAHDERVLDDIGGIVLGVEQEARRRLRRQVERRRMRALVRRRGVARRAGWRAIPHGRRGRSSRSPDRAGRRHRAGTRARRSGRRDRRRHGRRRKSRARRPGADRSPAPRGPAASPASRRRARCRRPTPSRSTASR